MKLKDWSQVKPIKRQKVRLEFRNYESKMARVGRSNEILIWEEWAKTRGYDVLR